MSHKTYMFKFILIVSIVVISSLSNELFAQIALPDDGDVQDAPEAPIDGFLAIAAAIGSYIGVRKLKK